MFKKYIILHFFSINILSCNNSLKEKEISIKENSSPIILTTKDAIKLSEKQFENYLPKILKSQEGVLESQQSYIGDFTGDGIEDIAIYFNLMANTGANVIVGQGLSLYQNKGNEVKVIAGFEPNYLFNVIKISDGYIFIEKLDYDKDDARCCPSLTTSVRLKVIGNKVYEDVK